MMQLLHDESLM